jgi:hypothetical protein
LVAPLIRWTLIALIAAPVFVHGQSRLGNSPMTEPHTGQAQMQSESRPCPPVDIHGGILDTAWSRVRCWYVSKKRDASENSHNLDINPHDNPIRQHSELGQPIETSTKKEARPPSHGRATARNCEEQALKLFDPDEMKEGGVDEKSTFIRQCKAN